MHLIMYTYYSNAANYIYLKIFYYICIMKKVVIIIIYFFATSLLFANSQIIEKFTGTNNNDEVIIEWKTKSENNVSRFELQRLSSGSFRTICSVTAKGTSSLYKHIDSDSFTKETITDNIQSANVVSYRIRIIYSNNSPATYTDEISVTKNNFSSIKRTLGMIKEMFK